MKYVKKYNKLYNKTGIILSNKNKNISLTDIFNIDELQAMQDAIASAASIASIIVDSKGHPVTKPSNYTRLYKDIISNHEKNNSICMLPVEIFENSKQGLVKYFNNGILWYGIIKMIIFDQHIANWFVGQVRVNRVSKDKVLSYIKEIGAEEDEFFSAFYEIPVMSKRQFNNVCNMVYIIASILSSLVNKIKEQVSESDKFKEIKQALKESEDRYAMLFREMQINLSLHEIICDENDNPVDYRFLDVNPAFERMTGLKREKVIGKTAYEIFPYIEKEWIENSGKVTLGGEPMHFETYSNKLDQYYDVVIFSPKKRQFATLVTDITKRKKIEKKIQQQYEEIEGQNEELAAANEEYEALNEELITTQNELMTSEKKYKALYNNALVAMTTVDSENGMIIETNELGYKIFGYLSRDEVLGKTNILDTYRDPKAGDKIYMELLEKGEINNVEVEFVRKDGTSFWGGFTAKYYPEEKIVEGIIVDITKSKQAEEKIAKLIFYDRLTELPNKSMLNNQLQMEIARSQRFAVICLGIDKFKRINDIYGKSIGDMLLKDIAVKLTKMYFKKDLVSRYESDKFMILLSDVGSTEDDLKIENIEKIIQKTLTIFSTPIGVDNYALEISASIGVCLYPIDGMDADSLIQNSESAMYVAKQKGGNTWHFFDAKLNEQMMNRFRLENELKQAIKNNEFIAYYQPKVNQNGEIIGMEALVRWKSSKRKGLIPPIEFIPIVEKNGMIVDIGNNIFKQTFIQNKNWQVGYIPIPISVNISPYQFRQRDLILNIRNFLIETGLDPKWLELEITETGIMENERDSIEKLNEIHNLGILISIDDFGTGYSSLYKLKTYPIDILKIDKSFIDDLPHDKMAVTIAITIIDLAHNLGFNVVAEGVETKEQFEFLIEHECDQFQGYYFYKPMPPEEIEKHLKKSLS